MESQIQNVSESQIESKQNRRVIIEGYTDPLSGKKYELYAIEHYQHINLIEKIEITVAKGLEGKKLTVYPVYTGSRLEAIDVYVNYITENEKWINLEARVNVMKNHLPYFFTIKGLESAIHIYEFPIVVRDIVKFIDKSIKTELKL